LTLADHVSVAIVEGGNLLALGGSDHVAVVLDEYQFHEAVGPTFAAAVNGEPGCGPLTRWRPFAAFAAQHQIDAAATRAVPIDAPDGGPQHCLVVTAYLGSRDDATEEFQQRVRLAATTAARLLCSVDPAPDGSVPAVGSSQSVGSMAAGMVAEQLNLPVVEALVRLRAHARANALPLQEVAARVVAGELVFRSPG
jgi:hypothetical protein